MKLNHGIKVAPGHLHDGRWLPTPYSASNTAPWPKFSPALVERLRVKQQGICGICGSCIEGEVEVDHIAPRSRGGSDLEFNLQLACKACNRLTGNRRARLTLRNLRI